MLTLTKAQARAMLIRYHNLDGADRLRGIAGARAIMDRLGSIQYDPLNVAGRNADLVLQARVRDYRPEMLARMLYDERLLVDGYDKEMCIYTARDFGGFAPVRRLQADDMEGWLRRRGQAQAFELLDEVRGIIAQRGPCQLTDIAIGESQAFGWGPRRPSGAAMEYLFRSGELCVSGKKHTQRLFDLTERLLPPEWIAEPVRDDDAFADWYVRRRVQCVGLLWGRMGAAWQGYVLSGDRGRRAAFQRLVARGELVECAVEGVPGQFYAVPEAAALADRTVGARHVRFIAPLDNLMWHRDMVEALFGFRYRWEVYTPVEKREYGYYVLPVLYGTRFIARFEPENVGKAGELRVKGWWWEPGVRVTRTLLDEIEAALVRFGRFLDVPVSERCMEAVRGSGQSST